MNLTAIEDALRAWVVQASGLPDSAVIFEHQDGVSKVPGPSATLSMGDLLQVGLDALDTEFDESAANGQEIIFTVNGPRTFTCNVTFFAPDTTGDAGARAAAARCQAGLRLPSVRYALNQAGLGVLKEGPVRWVPRIEGTGWLGQAVLEVEFNVNQSATERTGYIETVVASFGTGPVLWVSRWEDKAKLLKLDRLGNVTTPSMPRRISGARGGATQFTRAGANVVSGSVRDFGLLVDRNTDALIHRAIGDSHTLAAWVRIDPLVVLAGVAAPSYRLFAISGADGSIVAQQATYGFSFNPVTMELFLLTQTPGAGGTSINLNRSKLGVPLALNTWTHVAASVRRNGLDVEPNEWGATVDWYVNGALINSEVGTGGTGVTGPRIPRPSLYPPPRIVTAAGGAYSNTVGAFTNGFDGALDEVVLFPRALSAADVSALFTNGPFGLRV